MEITPGPCQTNPQARPEGYGPRDKAHRDRHLVLPFGYGVHPMNFGADVGCVLGRSTELVPEALIVTGRAIARSVVGPGPGAPDRVRARDTPWFQQRMPHAHLSL
jgi:hypothetical protein